MYISTRDPKKLCGPNPHHAQTAGNFDMYVVTYVWTFHWICIQAVRHGGATGAMFLDDFSCQCKKKIKIIARSKNLSKNDFSPISRKKHQCTLKMDTSV